MFSGDSLSVISILFSTMIGAVIAAIPTAPGTARNILWGIAALFGLLLLAWVLAPMATPAAQSVRAFASAFFQSGAFIMFGTVGIVALMQGGRKAPAKTGADFAQIIVPKTPKFATQGDSKWKPDLALQEAILYLGRTAQWRRTKANMNVGDVKRELLNSLRAGKLTAWAMEHPDHGEYYQVRNTMWGHADLSAETGSAFFPSAECSGYAIKLARGELESAYPSGN